MDPLGWLLHPDTDPALRWQALRDLTDAPAAALAAERARIPRHGLGAAILAAQQPDGAWRRPDTPAWVTTLFTLLLLRATGIDPADPAAQTAIARCVAGLRWNEQPYWDVRPASSGGNPFFHGEEEPCINGGVLALAAYFGHPSAHLATRLLDQQLAEGGWNCEAPRSTRASFHSTICVLDGLLEHQRTLPPGAPLALRIAAARQRAEHYLLERRLFRRLSNGEVIDPAFLTAGFPPRYRYDVLRALDYFRAAAAPRDPRMDEALQALSGARQPDGFWLLDRTSDEAAVPTGESPGQPSRWNTLRALRVLRHFAG